MRCVFGLVLGLLGVGCAAGEIRLPNVMSDHAVLQRERPIHVWGWATPGAEIKASLHGQASAGTADRLGHWSVYLKPEAAGGPYELTLNGDGAEVRVKDLLVGDVWVASGQSNMEMPLAGFPGAVIKNGAAEIAAATNPRLRLLVVEKKASEFPLRDAGGRWTECTPETAKNFSAVAYFFGREIAERERVPVGLIDSSWGGTPADAWVSLDTLGSDARLQAAFASRAEFAKRLREGDDEMAAEKRETAAAKAAGQAAESYPWLPAGGSWAPAELYNGMIAPFTPLTIKGFLWYQGETNSQADRAPYYADLFAALIGDWRARFAQGELPFLYVQISSFRSPGEDWGLVRDAQRRALALANTAMAVSLDVGTPENVHPPDKQTVGGRLALAARGVVYGEKIAYEGPTLREATVDGNGVRVWLDHAQGLTMRGRPVMGFEVAGADRKFVAAESALEGETVRVRAGGVADPRYVRYGWASVVENSLYNGAGCRRLRL